ncbi:protein of unknown function [Cyanobium sp. NIES-981]|nr:protein of unknown function [Cyanobium sp. NIES-981]
MALTALVVELFKELTFPVDNAVTHIQPPPLMVMLVAIDI